MKLPAKFTSIGVAILGASVTFTSFGAKVDDPYADVIVSKSYEAPGLGRTELAGACSATPDSIDCWNADGTPDAHLTEKVKAVYIVQANQQLSFKFGRKNRLVVFMLPPIRQGGTNLGMPMKSGGQYAEYGGQLQNFNSGSDPHLEWYCVDTPLDQKTLSLSFDMNSSIGTATVPFHEGTVAQVGPLTIKLGQVGSYKAPINPYFSVPHSNNKQWSIPITVTGNAGKRPPSIGAVLLDKNGAGITFVDKNGNPISDQAPIIPNQQRIWVQSIDTTWEGKRSIVIPVEPSKVASLTLNCQAVRKLTFTDIPLDKK